MPRYTSIYFNIATSRARFITGAQYVLHALPAFMKALASLPICCPVAHHRDRLKDIAVVIGNAKFDSYLVFGPLFTCEIPCVASDHLIKKA